MPHFSSSHLTVLFFISLFFSQKSLLKNVANIDAQEFEGAADDATPEELLLQWMNHHLRYVTM